MNNIDIQSLFEGIMMGNGSLITSENIQLINKIALDIYNKKSLSNDEIDILKKIIMICNVLYNRSDLSILPVEDGFYDLLLERYKTFDSNFQVGSAVIDFRNLAENDMIEPTKVAQSPVIFYENEVKKDETHQFIFDKIMQKGDIKVDIRNYNQCPVTFENQYIEKRTHNTEHNHPSLVGTLDKCKFVLNQDAINAGAFDDPNVKILERDFFQDHISKGIINPNAEYEMVVELKYDGISVEADCGLELMSARTRGDTGLGVAADITPILQGYIFKHANCMIGEKPIGVKFEAIMKKSNLDKFNELRGRSYVNCRSAIVGLFGSSDAYKYRDFITLVPLAIDRENFDYPIDNRLVEIEFMNETFISHGEPLRYCYFKGTIPELLYLIKAFLDEAKIARDYLDFMYDGIVVSYLDENIRAKLGRVNYINKYSMAVKFDPLEKQTIFRGYTYEVGQHGNITPMIHYDPVEFLGTIHTKSTGSSLNRFKELGLKYGDYINVKYVNDVMPYVSKLDCEQNRINKNPVVEIIHNCPICGSELVISDSGKSLLCPNHDCPGRSLQRMVNTFAKLNIKGFADATFKAIREMDHLYKFYEPNATKEYFVEKLGEADGHNMVECLNNLITQPIKDYILMGSLGFTSIAYKKWQSILQNITINDMYNSYISLNDPIRFREWLITMSPGIGDVTVNVIANEFGFFLKDIELFTRMNNIINSFGMDNSNKIKIRFSGCRNLQLAELLCNSGFDADGDSGVTKDTDILLIPYDGFSSGKVTKAKNNPKTKIIPIDEFITNMDKYIGIKVI